VTLLVERVETLVIARATVATRPLGARELVQALARFAPTNLAEPAWRGAVTAASGDLRTREILDADLRVRDTGELARRIGPHAATAWPQLADRILPCLALGIAANDTKTHARLAGRDAWAAAIAGRALALWTTGAPPSLAAVCDAYAWHQLGLAGKPKRCPPEIRALFIQRELSSEAGPPDRQVRLLAARALGVPRSELRALRDALVRTWLAGRTVGLAAPDDRDDRDDGFTTRVREVARSAKGGVFGDRKVFISSVWNDLRRSPSWAQLTLDAFKARLVAAHRAGDLVLARADLVAAMNPELVAASETTTDGASFHFIVREAS
jgi:hypothetical protein